MATYVFEQITQEQAAGFTSADFLVFTTQSVNAVNLTVTPNAQTGLQVASFTLTAAGISRTFPGEALRGASLATNNQIIFSDQSRLVLGSTTADTPTSNSSYAGFQTTADVIYGYAGDDILGTASNADGSSVSAGGGADYLYGGTGADTLYGGDGNDHLYGNALTTTQGGTDGDDFIFAGRGNDYVQGNAGADSIDGGLGNDRLNGGADGDTINGGRGLDVINGNQGNDSIDGGSGNDILRGGQGNDVINGGTASIAVAGDAPLTAEDAGNDIIYGDLGADTITGGAGFDVLFGGNGTAGADTSRDVFVFGATDATTANIAGAPGATGTSNIVDIIGDYTDGTDKIDFANVITAVTYDNATTPTSFGSLNAALTYAQQLADNTATVNTAEVVSLNYQGNTYLFTTSGAGNIDTVVQLTGVTASSIDTTDFI